MSEFTNGPRPQFQPKPPKKHTVRNVVIGVVVGGFLLIGGCTALIGGALSSVDNPTTVTSPVDNGPTPDPVTTPTNQNTPTVPPAKPTPKPSKAAPTKTTPALTASQEQAIGSAQDYLSMQAFSRKGLIKQLSSQYGEGFSLADATFAVDHVTVNWNEQAAKAAKQYLSMQHFSRQGLIHQLESAYGEQFTHRQAVYGVTKAGL